MCLQWHIHFTIGQLYTQLMFYVGHLLRTKISFAHSHLKDLSDYPYLLKHLKQAVEGRCLPENGFLIQVLPMKGYQKQKGIRVSAIEVTEEACQALIYFDCLCFKAQKGDIIDFLVEGISYDMIRGKLGAAQIIIPRQRMSSLIYKENDNVYLAEEDNGDKWVINVGSVLRCRVLEWVVHGESSMKIIGEVDQFLLQTKYSGKIE